jgi:hypothetical protein
VCSHARRSWSCWLQSVPAAIAMRLHREVWLRGSCCQSSLARQIRALRFHTIPWHANPANVACRLRMLYCVAVIDSINMPCATPQRIRNRFDHISTLATHNIPACTSPARYVGVVIDGAGTWIHIIRIDHAIGRGTATLHKLSPS